MTQNLLVVACCISVCIRLVYVELYWRRVLLEFCVITLAVIAQLASVAYKIAIEKDWIVVVAAGNKALLASRCFGCISCSCTCSNSIGTGTVMLERLTWNCVVVGSTRLPARMLFSSGY